MTINLLLLAVAAALPPAPAQASGGGGEVANPVVMIIVLGALSLAPFVVIMLTSFVKISVVLSILRNALGTQQVPPNQVITGLAFILTIFVMLPVAQQMYQAAGSISNTRDIFSEASVKSLYEASKQGKEPLRKFLAKHSHSRDRALFMELAVKMNRQGAESRHGGGSRQSLQGQQSIPSPSGAPSAVAPSPQSAPSEAGAGGQQTPETVTLAIDKDDFQIIIPSFVTSELKEAFQIGFLIFLPFIIIDMVVANVLLAMGMHMLSPTVISLPFKLLLFVLIDGWYLVVRGLVLSYL